MPSANTRHRVASGRCCFLRGCGLCGVVLRSVAVFGSELPESNPNMTPSCQKISGKSIKRNREGFSRNPWGFTGNP